MRQNNHLMPLMIILMMFIRITHLSAQDEPLKKSQGVNIIITQSPKIIVTVEKITHNNCNGENKGAIDISAEGGFPPYEYFWSHGDKAQDVAGLKAGKYRVAVYDNFSCSDTLTVVINEPPALTAEVVSVKDILCYGYNQGEVDIEVEGGTAPYTYSWNNGSISQDLTGVTSGRYSVLITDANNCQEIITADVAEIPLIIRSVDDIENIKCHGDATGKINISVSGGVPPYTYIWSNGETTEDLEGLVAGTYDVTVQDAAGCTEVSTAKVIEPEELIVKFDNVLDIRCFGDNGGAINIGVTGGVEPYSYDWSDGQTTQDIAGVNAGTYSVRVTDANGCSGQLETEITEPQKLEVSLVSSSDVSFHNGNDGTIDIEPSGGVPPYSYKWNNGSETQDVDGLGIGNYSARVSDATGCSTVINVTIDQPSPLLVNVDEAVNISCNGNNSGNIAISVTGGVAPYTYLWNNGSTTEDVEGLTAGRYEVTITDANGFAQSIDTVLSEPPAFLASVNSVSNIDCHGVSEGAVDIEVVGGVLPYRYHWNNGMITQDITDVPAGAYSVKITDANRCEQNLEVTINEPEILSASIDQITHVACNGDQSGAIDISVNGGVEPYSYTWNNDTDLQDLNSIGAGNYSVTITDSRGCVRNLETTITEPVNLLVQEDRITHIDCFDSNSGAISLIVSGGVKPYSYAWNTNDSTQNLTNLKAGDYALSIVDANGCEVNYATTLTQPPKMLVAVERTVDNSCFGQNNGEVNISVSGGVTPYSYRWNTGSTSQDIINLKTGDYWVEIRDANRCLDSLSATITENPPLEASVAVRNISCNGDSSGAIDLSVEGGVAPYTYQWSNTATSQDISGLKTGQYSVSITDAEGCTKQVEAHVLEPSRFVAILESEVHVKCYGDETGGINIRATGGSTPYTYEWSNGASTEDLVNIAAGEYTLIVSDNNGCSETIQTTITQPTRVTYEVKSATNLTCNGDLSGSIDISITGGVGPYNYRWNNGATTQDLVGIAAGNYSVTISEANGCTKTLEATITEPPLLQVKLDTVGHIFCNGNNTGFINISTAGGVPPYEYSWSHGVKTEDVSGLVAGKYSVTVNDSNGCSQTIGMDVKEPQPFVASLQQVKNILCNGETTGEIILDVRGGVKPYKFAWNSGDTTQNLISKPAGNYSVNITDKFGCTQSLSAVITQPDKLVASLVASENVSCFGGTDGSINITVVGGTTPYSYSWNNRSQLQDLTDIPAGTYSVDITDANGCVDSNIEVTITQPEELIAGLSDVKHIDTYGLSTGAIDVSVSGGTSPYVYSWSNGETTQNIKDIPAGNYSLRVSDEQGCEKVLQTIVNQPPSLDVTVSSVENILCSGNNSGSIAVDVTGGVEPYIYEWSSGDTTRNISEIPAGDYSLTVSDANGHRKTITAKVSQPTPINITVDQVTHIMCNGNDTGQAIVSVTGGVSPYQYQWSNGATTKDLSNVPAGSYSFSITDSNGCTDSVEITINEPEELTARIVSSTNINCNGDYTGEVQIEVSGGTVPYAYTWSNGARTRDISELPSGSYGVRIIDANGCSRELSTIIAQPPKLNAAITQVIDNQCFGDSNGEITLDVSGGAGNYKFIWSHGDSTRSSTGLVAGEYEVIVRDSLGCEEKLAATITEPDRLTATIESIVDVSCFEESNGGIVVNIEGGSEPYTYSWNTGQSTQNLNNIVAGNYALSITDNKGCVVSVDAEVKEPPALVLELHSVQDNLCAFDENGLVDITVSGGVPPYSYAWSNGEKTEDLVDVVSDTYSVVVKDAQGCQNTLEATVNEPQQLTVAVDSLVSLKCNGDRNGFVSLKVVGGVAPYSYQWNNGARSAELADVPAGEYTARVSDSNGCITNLTTMIGEPPALIKTIDAITDIRCNADSTGAIYITTLEGSPPYQFEWSNGADTEDITGLTAGTYSLKITESNGCISTLEATIEEPAPFITQIEDITKVECFGDQTGAIDISARGGVPPYTYAWSNGSDTQDIADVIADNYSVMVTDANGCLNTINASIQQPEELALSIDSVRNVKCCGDDSGAIFISVTGGVGPYDYLWSNGATTEDIENLILGRYTVNVTDQNGCVITTLDDEQLNLYEQIVTQGKFITRDINFDIAKAIIKPESFRTINKIATLMKEHPDLTFRIDGHTDSDGSADFNQKLSEDRAESIKRAITKFGIGENRLYTKGWGEAKPIASNQTRAGKAQNRRVEFISLTGTLTGTMIENVIEEEDQKD